MAVSIKVAGVGWFLATHCRMRSWITFRLGKGVDWAGYLIKLALLAEGIHRIMS